jgi:hypothetical protein
VNGSVSANQFELAGGTLSVAPGGAFNIANGQRFTWSSGTITGGGSTNVLSGGLLTLFGNNSNTLAGTTLTNSGTIELRAGADLLRLGNGALIQNNSLGVFELLGDGQVFADAGNFGSVTNNAGGILRKGGGTGVSIFNAPLTNAGTIEVLSGTLSLTGTYTHNGGTIF